MSPVKRYYAYLLALLVEVAAFYRHVLFQRGYLFPWDFRGVQLPLITFLVDELRQGRFALWNPYNYCGYPVFANIEACYFHPLILLCALIASHTSVSLPQLVHQERNQRKLDAAEIPREQVVGAEQWLVKEDDDIGEQREIEQSRNRKGAGFRPRR